MTKCTCRAICVDTKKKKDTVLYVGSVIYMCTYNSPSSKLLIISLSCTESRERHPTWVIRGAINSNGRQEEARAGTGTLKSANQTVGDIFQDLFHHNHSTPLSRSRV
jgi:hypothetical protein